MGHLRTYNDHVHALLDRLGSLALDGGDALVDAVDAPRVALHCLSRSHGTPFNGRGRGGCGLFWKARSLRSDMSSHGPADLGFDCSGRGSKRCKKIEIRAKSVIPLLRERIILMYPAPKYRKESVFDGSFTRLTVESLNIRFLAGA